MKPTLDRTAAPLLVVTFHPTLTVEEARAHFREIGDAVEAVGRAGVVVDLSEAPLFSRALHVVGAAEMRAVIERSGHRLVGVSHVVRSAPARAMLAAVQWLAPPPFPTLITASRDEATSWAFDRLGRTAPHPASAAGSRRDARVVAGLARTVVTAARALAVPVEDSDFRAVGISRSDLVALDGYVPYGGLVDLLELLAARSGDPHFGLAVGRFVDAASLGVVGLAARSSIHLGDAIARTVRFARLIDENMEIVLEEESGGVRVVAAPLRPLEWPRHYAELVLAAFVQLCRVCTGESFAPSSIGFRHSSPPDAGVHQRFFGCLPRFDAGGDFVVVPTATLSRGLCGADPIVARYFDVRLDQLGHALAVAPGPLIDVRAATLRALSEGTPTVASIGRRLGLSGRTLQRRLNERGVTFADILDSVRREAALEAIARPGASIQELAASCGFADVKAVRRAFVRWTGQSPSEYRKMRVRPATRRAEPRAAHQFDEACAANEPVSRRGQGCARAARHGRNGAG
jgi:AraC-like DNA-binding protein